MIFREHFFNELMTDIPRDATPIGYPFQDDGKDIWIRPDDMTADQWQQVKTAAKNHDWPQVENLPTQEKTA